MSNSNFVNLNVTLSCYNTLGKLYNRLSRLTTQEQMDRCRSWFLSLVAQEECMNLAQAGILLDIVIAERIKIVKTKPVNTVNKEEVSESVNVETTLQPTTPEMIAQWEAKRLYDEHMAEKNELTLPNDNPYPVSTPPYVEGVDFEKIIKDSKTGKAKAKPKPRAKKAIVATQ